MVTIMQAVIFYNTKRKADWLTEKVREANFTGLSMHGDVPQKERRPSRRSSGLVPARWSLPQTSGPGAWTCLRCPSSLTTTCPTTEGCTYTESGAQVDITERVWQYVL